MKSALSVGAVCFVLSIGVSDASAQSIADRYRTTANRMISTEFADSSAWNRLAEMTDKFGNRLSGTENLEHTIDWVLAQMKADGLQNCLLYTSDAADE